MKTALIFPGQGSQYVKMGHDFYSKYDVSNVIFKEHPLNKHYSGFEDKRDWLFKIEGEFLSFFKYWNKIRKKLI